MENKISCRFSKFYLFSPKNDDKATLRRFFQDNTNSLVTKTKPDGKKSNFVSPNPTFVRFGRLKNSSEKHLHTELLFVYNRSEKKLL